MAAKPPFAHSNSGRLERITRSAAGRRLIARRGGFLERAKGDRFTLTIPARRTLARRGERRRATLPREGTAQPSREASRDKAASVIVRAEWTLLGTGVSRGTVNGRPIHSHCSIALNRLKRLSPLARRSSFFSSHPADSSLASWKRKSVESGNDRYVRPTPRATKLITRRESRFSPCGGGLFE